MGFGEETSKPIWGSVRSLHASSSSYAPNGKIMLSSVIILFFAMILILCFHNYARWLFRRQNRRIRRRIRAHLLSLAASRDSSISSLSPLDPTVLETIPIFIYSSETHKSPLEECSVCLSEFEEESEGRILPKCGHVFHVDCIDTWFKSRSNCPICRAPVQPETSTTTINSTEPTDPVLIKPVENYETGSPSSSSRVRLPVEACERDPIDLLGIIVEIPTDPGLPTQNGSKFLCNRVLSLQRLWSI